VNSKYTARTLLHSKEWCAREIDEKSLGSVFESKSSNVQHCAHNVLYSKFAAEARTRRMSRPYRSSTPLARCIVLKWYLVTQSWQMYEAAKKIVIGAGIEARGRIESQSKQQCEQGIVRKQSNDQQ